MKELRSYQRELAINANDILVKLGMVYLSFHVRTGKTATALETCKLFGSNNILFITKKKAIASIEADYKDFRYNEDFKLTVINKESLHLLKDNDFDCIVIDEMHGYGAYPKASKYQKEVRKRFGHLPVIGLSGTMSPESYSQIYHQFQISKASPFNIFTTFYKWASLYVNVKKKYLGYAEVNDYSEANFDMIHKIIAPYVLTFTQEEAGFKSKVNEVVLKMDMRGMTYHIISTLKRDNVFIGKSDTLTADTAVKLQQKIHQLSGGTIITDNGETVIIDTSKAEFIKDNFSHHKIAIFYKFKGELQLLKKVFGDRITADIDKFNADKTKWIAYQFVSGREGTNLSAADFIVMYSIDFSNVSYQQAKDRLSTIDRPENTVYWIFANKTLDLMIYNRVLEKKSFTNAIFKKEFLNV